MGRTEVASFFKSRLFAVILIGLVLRFVLAPLLTCNFDVTGWALSMSNILSGNSLYGLDGYYYTPVWGYVIGFLAAFQDLFLHICDFGGMMSSAFFVEHLGWTYSADVTTVAFNVFIKGFFFLLDLLVGYLIYWLVHDMTGDRKKAEIGFAIWFLCPLVFMVSSVGGMFDALVALFLVLTLIFVRRDHYVLAGAFFALAVYTKLFPAFLLFPLVAYVMLKNRDDKLQVMGKAVLGAVVVTVLVFLPMALQGHLYDTFGFILSRFSQGMGSGMSSSLEGVGTVIGYLAVLAVTVLVSRHYYKTADPENKLRVVELFVLVAAVVFLFPSAPQYIIMLVPFVAVALALGYRQLRWPAFALFVSTGVFVIVHGPVYLLSFAQSGGMSAQSVFDVILWYHDSGAGVALHDVVVISVGVIQWFAMLWLALVMARTYVKRTGPVDPGVSMLSQVRSLGTRFMDRLRNGTVLQRELILTGVFAVLAVVLFCIVQFTGLASSVVDGYFPYADAMFHGVFPYTEKVFVYDDWNVWEYPPLAYVFILIPRLIGPNPAAYQAVYLVMVLLFVWLGMRSVGRIAEHFGYDHLKAVLIYTGSLILMAEFVLDRYDLFPMVICILAVQFFLEKRYALTAVMVAIGTLVKLYPIILIPVFVIWFLRRNEVRSLAKSMLAFLATCVLIVPFLLLGDVSQFMGYHSARPLEIESLFASVLEAFALQFPDSGMHVIYSYGSDNLVGGISDAVAWIPTYVIGAVLACIWLLYFLVSRCGRDEDMYKTLLLSMCAFIIFGSVFSGQYVIWLIPFVMLVMMACRDRTSRTVWYLFIIMAAFTQLDFLVNFGMRPEGAFPSVAGVVILLVRNCAVLVMMYVLARSMLPKRTELSVQKQ